LRLIDEIGWRDEVQRRQWFGAGMKEVEVLMDQVEVRHRMSPIDVRRVGGVRGVCMCFWCVCVLCVVCVCSVCVCLCVVCVVCVCYECLVCVV
jgi:hypothetical protein